MSAEQSAARLNESEAMRTCHWPRDVVVVFSIMKSGCC